MRKGRKKRQDQGAPNGLLEETSPQPATQVPENAVDTDAFIRFCQWVKENAPDKPEWMAPDICRQAMENSMLSEYLRLWEENDELKTKVKAEKDNVKTTKKKFMELSLAAQAQRDSFSNLKKSLEESIDAQNEEITAQDKQVNAKQQALTAAEEYILTLKNQIKMEEIKNEKFVDQVKATENLMEQRQSHFDAKDKEYQRLIHDLLGECFEMKRVLQASGHDTAKYEVVHCLHAIQDCSGVALDFVEKYHGRDRS